MILSDMFLVLLVLPCTERKKGIARTGMPVDEKKVMKRHLVYEHHYSSAWRAKNWEMAVPMHNQLNKPKPSHRALPTLYTPDIILYKTRLLVPLLWNNISNNSQVVSTMVQAPEAYIDYTWSYVWWPQITEGSTLRIMLLFVFQLQSNNPTMPDLLQDLQ